MILPLAPLVGQSGCNIKGNISGKGERIYHPEPGRTVSGRCFYPSRNHGSLGKRHACRCKRKRLAPFPQIRLCRMKVVERVLGAGKAQMKQLAGRIVDEDEQGAFGPYAYAEGRLLTRTLWR